MCSQFYAHAVEFQIKLLKEKRQLVCSYLCTPCMLNNPSVYLLLAFLSIVFSGIYPTVLALICSMLFTFHSVPS